MVFYYWRIDNSLCTLRNRREGNQLKTECNQSDTQNDELFNEKYIKIVEDNKYEKVSFNERLNTISNYCENCKKTF